MNIHLYGLVGCTTENSNQVGEIIKCVPGRLEVRNTRQLSTIPLDVDHDIGERYIVVGLSDLSPDEVLSTIKDDLIKIGVKVTWRL